MSLHVQPSYRATCNAIISCSAINTSLVHFAAFIPAQHAIIFNIIDCRIIQRFYCTSAECQAADVHFHVVGPIPTIRPPAFAPAVTLQTTCMRVSTCNNHGCLPMRLLLQYRQQLCMRQMLFNKDVNTTSSDMSSDM